MKTIKHYTSILLEDYNKGTPANSSRLVAPRVYQELLSARAILTERRLNTRHPLSSTSYSHLICIPLKPVTDTTCLGSAICHSKNIRMSVIPIPKSLTGNHVREIQNLRDSNFNIVNLIDTSRVEFMESSKYTKGSVYAFLEGGYLYVANTTVQYLTAEILAYDPIEVQDFNSRCSSKDLCALYEDMPFPVEPGIEDAMIRMATERLSVFYGSLEDLSHDNKDSATQQTR